MIINIHNRNFSVRSLSTPNIPVSDRDALYIRASVDFITTVQPSYSEIGTIVGN